MPAKQGRKAEALSRLFAEVKKQCGNAPLVFDNQLAKKVTGTIFSNQYDVTKIDTSAKLPTELRKAGYFVIHLGEGRHQFVQGIEAGFHKLEPIPREKAIEWKYRPSPLDRVDTGQTSIFNLVNNQLILQDFLYDDPVVIPRLHPPQRIRTSFVCFVNGQMLRVLNGQMKAGPTVEHLGAVTICKGQAGEPQDFAVWPLYSAFRYLCDLRDKQGVPIKSISVLFENHYNKGRQTMLELRQYHFRREERLDSLELLKAFRYQLVGC